jgi:hypothetical protein
MYFAHIALIAFEYTVNGQDVSSVRRLSRINQCYFNVMFRSFP